MGTTKTYFAQFYRNKPGDRGIEEFAVFSDQDYEKITADALLAYFNSGLIPTSRRPRRARLVNSSGEVLFTLAAVDPFTVKKCECLDVTKTQSAGWQKGSRPRNKSAK
jgi:hypothetical protein